ncbi:EscS/YscS/HrcS family type III secretion system export apparatus protein [Bradyrhizobium sp. STM 3557]|uniref:EscS/YscS/HrcS family type III secretion system export apparatus protein n=1 Tax=Bradyrhizobium sp. STM 3557 TaxID=578920 RepID=UPI00388E322E
MTQTALIDQLAAMLGIVLVLALPPLIAAMVVGLIVGILQAVTQVQDQSLPIAMKLLAVIVVIIFAGPLLVQPLVRQSGLLFDSFPTMAR